MPEDIVKSREGHEARSEEMTADVQELRRAVLDLGRMLKKFGKKRVDELGEDLELRSDELVHEGSRALRDLEHRLGQMEKNVERSVRDHPGAWAGGLLGVIGFGLILGMILRRHH